jgi:hypothetical protein
MVRGSSEMAECEKSGQIFKLDKWERGPRVQRSRFRGKKAESRGHRAEGNEKPVISDQLTANRESVRGKA